MPTNEERIATLEFDLKQFKTTTIKAYGDMAMELVVVKRLGEDTIKRLTALQREMNEDFDSLLAQLNQRFAYLDAQLAAILAKLNERM